MEEPQKNARASESALNSLLADIETRKIACFSQAKFKREQAEIYQEQEAL